MYYIDIKSILLKFGPVRFYVYPTEGHPSVWPPWTTIPVGPDFNFFFIGKTSRQTLSDLDKASHRLSLAIGYGSAAASQGAAGHRGLPDLACPWLVIADLASYIRRLWFPDWVGFVSSKKIWNRSLGALSQRSPAVAKKIIWPWISRSRWAMICQKTTCQAIKIWSLINTRIEPYDVVRSTSESNW